MPATKKKVIAHKPTKKPGRKPNQYVTVWHGQAEGPYTTDELSKELQALAEDDVVNMDDVKVFKLDHEVSFKMVPAKFEIQNGSVHSTRQRKG